MSEAVYARNAEDQDLKRRRPSPKYQPSKKSRSGGSPHELEEKFESAEELAKQYKKYQSAAKFDYNSEELFCVCRKPDHGELMIACDGCEDWFHFKCMNLNAQYSKMVAKFFCKFCQWKGKGVTLWKRKCRLDWCYEAIRANSKYCSDSHGILFMKENLKDRNHSINDLKVETIKEVLNHTKSYLALQQLGSEFPELQEVRQFKQTQDLSKFPESVEKALASLNQRSVLLNEAVQTYTKKAEKLLFLKDLIKGINDKLTDKNEEKTTTKKKPRAKKIDICLYDRSLNENKAGNSPYELILEEISKNPEKETTFIELVQQKTKDEIDQDWFDETLCIQERRKCARHNGWWNLVNDDIGKRLNELNVKIEKVENEKEQILRNYSIAIYESSSSKEDNIQIIDSLKNDESTEAS